MASKVPRTSVSKDTIQYRKEYSDKERSGAGTYGDLTLRETTSKLWRSEGHPVDRSSGKRLSGGPFHVTHSEFFFEPGYAEELCKGTTNEKFFVGPLMPPNIIPAANVKAKYSGVPKDQDTSSLDSLGATAISQCAPTNPTSNLGVSLGEIMHEKKLPSLHGITTWKERTNALRGLGSEYLNHQFGWAPLVSEVHAVTGAARHQRDIMKNYAHNEGRDVHRRFDFPIEVSEFAEPVGSAYVGTNLNNLSGYASVSGGSPAECQTCFRKETKRWFEGCFTYGGPSGADNFRRHLGFGSKADQLYGLQLTPSLLWELTPWSWAVDWFSNAGDVINNVTNFALAGLVMRYGFMMEETIEEYYTEFSGCRLRKKLKPGVYGPTTVSPARSGVRMVTKSRTSANPFGFGIGWEGLSPTQLAITAALGITRVLK